MNLTVLVTDNDEKFLEVAKRKLSEREFNVLVSNSPVEALELLKDKMIDAVYLNTRDTKRNGLILKYVKTLKKKPALLSFIEDTPNDLTQSI